MKRADALKLVISLVMPQLAGALGAAFTSAAIPSWYSLLEKPAANPPSWVFGPVWTVLYLLMGIAAFIVWRRAGSSHRVRGALGVFGIQLVLNALWSVVFFGLRAPGVALAVIALLWLAIIWTIARFSGISRTAAWMLLPYLLWVSFASYLNYSIFILNR